jgi:uncharacterized membrane protein
MPPSDKPDHAPEIDRGTHRIEGFSDGFFAIVITLLVLDLRPPALPEETTSFMLEVALRALWPEAAAFTISFVNIYILWVAHHELIRITTRADTRFLYLNGGVLFGVALLPFATAMLSEHIQGPGARYAAAIYTGAFLWIACFYNLVWRYVATHPDRLLPTVTRHDRGRISRTYVGTLALYAVAFAISWILPMASVAITLALAVFFAVADRLSGFASEDIAND